MYAGVPRSSPACVKGPLARIGGVLKTSVSASSIPGYEASDGPSRANPKSSTRARPRVFDHDIVRLEVAVKIPSACAASRPRPACTYAPRSRERPWPGRAPGAESHSIDVLHREEDLSVEGPGVVYRDHVRVRETRERLRLTQESMGAAARVGLARLAPQELERDAPVEFLVVRHVDDAHPAATESLQDRYRLTRAPGRSSSTGAGSALSSD